MLLLDHSLRDAMSSEATNPTGDMVRFVLVGVLCAHLTVAFWPTIMKALKMLKGDIEVLYRQQTQVSASSVYQGCFLEIFGVLCLINLIPISMRDVYMIVWMDWLSRFGVMIDCEGGW